MNRAELRRVQDREAALAWAFYAFVGTLSVLLAACAMAVPR